MNSVFYVAVTYSHHPTSLQTHMSVYLLSKCSFYVCVSFKLTKFQILGVYFII